MSDISTSDVVLRLVMKNMDPAEATRLAAQSVAGIETELKASLARQAAAHQKAAEAQTKEAQKAANEEIKAAEKASKGLIQAQRAVAAEAKKTAGESQTHWRRLLEDMENATVVAQGMAAAVSSIAGKLKAAADEIINTTNIMGSFKGSVQEASDATQNTVSNMDLIIARNRAMALDLKMTDQQFADLAQAADAYSDSMGIKGTEAMDKMIQSLGTGTEKGLKQLGVIKDTDKIYQEFAKTLGTTSDKLSDEGKRTALQAAAFIELRKRAIDGAAALKEPVNVATALEQAIVDSKNSWDSFVLAVGSWKVPDWLIKILGPVSQRSTKGRRDLLGDQLLAELKSSSGEASVAPGNWMAGALKQIDEAKKNDLKLAMPEGLDKKDMIDPTKSPKPKDYSMSQGARGMLRAAEEQIRAQDRVDEEAIRQQQDAEKDIQRFYEELTGESASLINEKTKKGEKDQLDYEKKFSDLRQKALEAGAELKEKLGKTNEKAGGGLFARMLFGPDGPEVLYEQMDGFQRAVVDSTGMISNAAEGMAGAFGQSFAAWAQGTMGFKAAMAEATRDVLKNLATQAATHAIMETALGLGSLALGPIGGVSAAGHFAAAAAFGAVAGAAGAGLRALGPSPTPAKAGSAATTPRVPAFSASGGGRSSGGGDGQTPMIFNVSVFPGGEQAAGEAIVKALEARKAQTGRGIDHLMS